MRIVLVAPENVLLAGSNDETQFPGMPGQIGFTLNFINSVAERARSSVVVKVLRQKTTLVSLLRDERMLVTSYLTLDDDA